MAVSLQILEESLQVVDRHATGSAASGHPGQIGGVQSKLCHAGLHARGEIAHALGMGGDRQTGDGGLHGGGRGGAMGFHWRLFGLGCRGLLIESEALGLLFGNFNFSQCGSHRVAFPLLGENADEFPRAGRGNLHHSLGRFDLNDVLVGGNVFALGDQEANDGGLGNGLTELGHQKW